MTRDFGNLHYRNLGSDEFNREQEFKRKLPQKFKIVPKLVQARQVSTCYHMNEIGYF